MKSNSAILVIGPPSSGKTYISESLSKQGYPCFDADQIPDLARWVDSEGNTNKFPKNADQKWLSSHKFVWDRTILSKYIEKERPVVIFGLSSNCFEMLDLFDRAYYLKISPEEALRRLSDPKRVNPMGKTLDQKKSVIAALQSLDAKAEQHGLSMIEANQTPEDVWKKITV